MFGTTEEKEHSLDPLDHIGHNIVLDKFARDLRISRPPGNGFCMECSGPVCCDVQVSGIFTEKDAERERKERREMGNVS